MHVRRMLPSHKDVRDFYKYAIAAKATKYGYSYEKVLHFTGLDETVFDRKSYEINKRVVL
jgi:hypothetical protein